MNIELLLEIHKEQAKQGERLARIEANLADHIRRTHALETKMEWIEKRVWIVYGIALAGSTLVSFLSRILT